MEDPVKSKEENEYDSYIQTIKQLRQYSLDKIEKRLVLIAGGGLVFTMGFYRNIVGGKDPSFELFLLFTWIFFTGSLVINLFSHRSAFKAMDYELSGDEIESDKMDKRTSVLNEISVYFIILGIISFITFVYKNI